jgi:hypothetical protein
MLFHSITVINLRIVTSVNSSDNSNIVTDSTIVMSVNFGIPDTERKYKVRFESTIYKGLCT